MATSQRQNLSRSPRAPRSLTQTRDALRLALTRADAADCLGMSVDSFERYVQPEIRLVRRGTLRLVPVAELGAWLQKNAEMPLSGDT